MNSKSIKIPPPKKNNLIIKTLVWGEEIAVTSINEAKNNGSSFHEEKCGWNFEKRKRAANGWEEIRNHNNRFRRQWKKDRIKMKI